MLATQGNKQVLETIVKDSKWKNKTNPTEMMANQPYSKCVIKEDWNNTQRKKDRRGLSFYEGFMVVVALEQGSEGCVGSEEGRNQGEEHL